MIEQQNQSVLPFLNRPGGWRKAVRHVFCLLLNLHDELFERAGQK
jgi:hypothetical protein